MHASGVLSQAGRKTLIVDGDPQSAISAGLIGSGATREFDPEHTIYAVHAGIDPYPEQVIRPTTFAGIDLLPSHRAAAKFNIPEPHTAPVEVQLRLRNFLEEVRDKYDYILIDTAPSLSMATWTSLVASDYYLIVSQPEDYGAMGTVDVIASAERVNAGPNPHLTLLGLVISMIFPRRSLHKLYEQKLRDMYGSRVLAATIPHLSDYPEAISSRTPVSYYKPKGAATRAIRAVTAEILTRIQAIESDNLVGDGHGQT